MAKALGAAKDARDSGHSDPAMALVPVPVFPDARCPGARLRVVTDVLIMSGVMMLSGFQSSFL
jgi:hypothetical protein